MQRSGLIKSCTYIVGSNMFDNMKHWVAMGGAWEVAAGTWGFTAGAAGPPGIPCICSEFLA